MKVTIYKIKDRDLFRCEWREQDKRKVKNFKTETEAKAFAKSLEKVAKEYGRRLVFEITDEMRLFLIECENIRKIVNVSYRDLESILRINCKVRIDTQEFASINVNDALDSFYADCASRRLRERTQQTYEANCDLLFKRLLNFPTLKDIKAEDIVRLIKGRYSNPRTQITFKRPICTFLNYCSDKGWIEKGFADKVTWRTGIINETRVKFLTVKQTESLIRAVPQRFQPAIALGLFAGIRPQGELQRIEWDAIDFQTKTVSIGGEVSKTHAFRRMHDLPDNLWACLALTPENIRKGMIMACNDSNYRNMFKAARDTASIFEYPSDAMRHSFGSYGFHRGLEWCVDTMGHIGGFRTFVKHYKGAASKEESEKYFSIMP